MSNYQLFMAFCTALNVWGVLFVGIRYRDPSTIAICSLGALFGLSGAIG